MASGGGTPPSHLSIPQLPNNFPSAADTLKTPQLTLTPVTSINSAVDGGGKSFTSLEELLNITGINTPTGSRPDNGVSSLSRIAQAVENSQNGPQGDLPPAKRPRLELPSNTNIRVQPLTSPSVTIASLLHKPSIANHTGSNIPTTNFNPTNTPQSINSTVAQALSALTHVLSANSSSINATLSQAVSTQPTIVSVIPSLMQSPATSPTSSNPKSFLLQLVQLYKHYQNTGDSDGMERIKKQLNVLVTATQGRNQPSNPLLGALSMLSGPSTTVQQQVSSGANSLINRTQTTSTVLAGTTVSRPNMHVPPSLLSSTQLRTIPSNSRPQAAVTTGMTATRATNPSPQATTSTALAEQISVQQKAVKQLQTIMASLPVSSRPKTAQEIRDFVQKYSNLITQLQSSTPSTTTSAQSTKTQQNPVTTLHGSVVVPMNFGPSPAQTTTTANSTAASISTTAMAQVDQHFQTALTAVKNKSTLPTKPPAVVDLTTDTDSASTVNAPITTQFKATPKATKATTGIQAGVATPLPPGLTLETLAVLCRLPESELGKLKLPVGLLSAIKVWKEKQPTKKGGSPHTKTSSSSNIPILYPPSSMSGPSHLLKTPTAIKVGEALSLTSTMSDFKQPFVIPSGAGFPPRSLHAFVPGLGQSRSAMTSTAAKLFPTAATPHRPSVTLGRPPSHHMTRVRTKAEQEKAERERIQALTKALQSSEEARIAFRFNTHLDKMHSQLLAPDTTTSFANKQDVLSRLLPYHVYAQCEPPVAAVEKADAVFESVAQVLLSRSRGLQSRFQQLLAKTDSRGGEDAGVMDLELRRCFVQGERERVKQEKLQKQQAEQVAANLSMMVKADGVDTFDSEFSLSDAFFPFLDNGIT
ncbi:mucin-5AC-like isoform X2 [Halichondria panicea]|uniref:mucin-5AC-like isoform X2 n=1 Tax=Halichondria panicea TaxID=6063 RepID=UPI00312B6553